MQKYTVFTKDAYYLSNDGDEYEGVSLQTLIDGGLREFGDVYVAWAPEWPSEDEDSSYVLLAESLAAGRTIIMNDQGKYIPLGIPEQEKGEEQKFRIGGVYRDMGGRIIRLRDEDSSGSPMELGHAWAQVFEKRGWSGDGYRTLTTGKDESNWILDSGFARHLLPGELHQINGSWVPINSGEQKAGFIPGGVLPTKCTPVLNTTEMERKRAPLTWATKTPFDPFKGWEPVKGLTANEPTARGLPSPDLNPTGHQPYYMHGSALLHTKR